MKPTDLNRPRRIFLGVVLVLALVLGWELSRPWRTGIQEYKVGSDSVFGEAFNDNRVRVGTNQLYWWSAGRFGVGLLGTAEYTPGIEFAPCSRERLEQVTPEDTRVEFAQDDVPGRKIFGGRWSTNCLSVGDGEILLFRNRADTQTVYALEIVEQTARSARFRTRKIPPAAAVNHR